MWARRKFLRCLVDGAELLTELRLCPAQNLVGLPKKPLEIVASSPMSGGALTVSTWLLIAVHVW